MGEDRGPVDDAVHRLGERVKELTALHATARLMLQEALTQSERLTAVVALLPPAMQFPEITTACIRYGEGFATPGHATTPWMLRSSFATSTGAPLDIEVAYHEERPFLDEELALLASLGEMLRASIERQDGKLRLEQLTERCGLALEAAGVGVWEWDVVNDRVMWCEQLSVMTGLQTQVGSYGEHRELVHPEDRDYLFTRLQRAVVGGDELRDLSFRFRRPDGGWRHMMARARIWREPPARATRIVAALVDVSERRVLEEGLRQAQKVEALGQVAGGVAHDFNNLLAVLLCNTELLRAETPTDHPWRDLIDELHGASERGRALTQQLLSFSRKATFKPVAIDVCNLAARLEPLLVRIAHKAVKVALELDRAAGSVWADPVQIEQVIMNLVVNARDAMPDGGHVTVRVASAERDGAAYVATEVQDTGVGIEESIKARLFEPFFTTKDPGKGTGLGLAVVAGAAQQWNGRVEVESTLGEGATFRVLFPRIT